MQENPEEGSDEAQELFRLYHSLSPCYRHAAMEMLRNLAAVDRQKRRRVKSDQPRPVHH